MPLRETHTSCACRVASLNLKFELVGPYIWLDMRIHLPLPASFFDASSKTKKDAPPIVQLGGELVLMELQGEIQVEGERAGGVVGVLGFERPVSIHE